MKFSYQKIYKQTFILIFKNFFNDPRSIFFVFFMPIINFSIFNYVISDKTQAVAGGYLIITPLLIGVNSLSLNLIEWKNSILFKRLSITPIKKGHFFLIILNFYFLVILFSSLWTFFWIEIIAGKNLFTENQKINWNSFIFGWLSITFTSINLGVFIAGVSRSQNTLQALVFLIYFPTAFLTGMTFPIYELGLKNDFINVVSFLLPHKLPAAWANAAWNGKNVYEYINISLLQVIIFIIIINVMLLLLSKLTFRWETSKD